MARIINGWNYSALQVTKSMKYIENGIGRSVTEDEAQEIAQLWDWNYTDDDCIDMLKNGMDAIGYDMEAYEAGDVEDFHC